MNKIPQIYKNTVTFEQFVKDSKIRIATLLKVYINLNNELTVSQEINDDSFAELLSLVMCINSELKLMKFTVVDFQNYIEYLMFIIDRYDLKSDKNIFNFTISDYQLDLNIINNASYDMGMYLDIREKFIEFKSRFNGQ